MYVRMRVCIYTYIYMYTHSEGVWCRVFARSSFRFLGSEGTPATMQSQSVLGYGTLPKSNRGYRGVGYTEGYTWVWIWGLPKFEILPQTLDPKPYVILNPRPFTNLNPSPKLYITLNPKPHVTLNPKPNSISSAVSKPDRLRLTGKLKGHCRTCGLLALG